MNFRPGTAGLALLLLAVAGVAVAQQEPGLTVAVIDNDRVLEESNPGKVARQRLEESANRWQQRIEQKRRELDDLQRQRQQQALTLSPEALRRLDAQIEEKQVEMDRLRADAQRDFNRLRDQVLGELEQELVPMVQRLAQENGYQIILNSQTPGLLYFSTAIDATDQLIALINRTSPAPSGAAPSER